MLLRPSLNLLKEVFPHALRANVGVDDDVVDLELFSRIEADGYPAIGHGDEFAMLPEPETMVGGEGEHVGEVGAYFRGGFVRVEFIGQRDDGGAVAFCQFAEFHGVVVLDGLAGGHSLLF